MAPKKKNLGEFEQSVLLAIVETASESFAIEIARVIETRGGRAVSRGALYTTLERLEEKGCLEWSIEEVTPENRAVPRRRFEITELGVEMLRQSRAELLNQLKTIDSVLGPGA